MLTCCMIEVYRGSFPLPKKWGDVELLRGAGIRQNAPTIA